MRMKTGMFTVWFLILAQVGAYAAGDIQFTPKNAEPVVFSHDLHTKYRGVKCMACHFDRFAAGSNGFKINQQMLNKRDFCGHCHNGLKAFDLETQKNCGRCHKK